MLAPNVVELKRLFKTKKEQEERLKMLQARVNLLKKRENNVWKDVKSTQHMSLQQQDVQRRKHMEQLERVRVERDERARQGALQMRAQDIRTQRAQHGIPRQQKFEEKQLKAHEARDYSRRTLSSLDQAREQAQRRKAQQVAQRREECRQHKLMREQAIYNQENARRGNNVMKYTSLQEDVQNIEEMIAQAEREEMAAMHRLQDSQQVRAMVFSELQAAVAGGAPHCEEPCLQEVSLMGSRSRSQPILQAVAEKPPAGRGPSPRSPGFRPSPRTVARRGPLSPTSLQQCAQRGLGQIHEEVPVADCIQ